MAIITVIGIVLVFTIPTALYEGSLALIRRAKEAAEWRRLKKIYY